MKKSFYIMLVLVFVSAVWYGCKDKIELPGELHGVVTDKATGEPIKTAGVELQPVGLKTVTGTDGQYGFNEIEPGKYKLYITKTGYADWLSNEIVVKSEQIAQGDVQLEKLPPALRIVNDKQEDIDELDFGAAVADVARSFNIFNDGVEKLQWQITKTADWITEVSKDNGELGAGKSQSIIVTIDREKLDGGNNVTTMHITSDDGSKQLNIKAVGEKRSLPVLNTLDATEVKMTSAIFHGELTDVGVPSYTERGFVYALSSMPTIENTISKLTVAVTADKAFQATATGLEEDKTYYVRAYAINKAGTAYSTNEVKCEPKKTLPSITTDEISHKSIAEGRVTLNATITDAGEPAYTERGFVYGTSHNPMLEDGQKIPVPGLGTGMYSINLTNLTVGELYYVRAYATNVAGTVYGAEEIIDFHAIQPEIQTLAVTDIGPSSATLQATICGLGVPSYTEAGFIYGTMPNPTIEDEAANKAIVTGTGIGTFNKKIEDLEEGETYYVRAYLRNEYYTVYGEIVSFKAESPYYVIIPGTNLMVQKTTISLGAWHDAAISMCENSVVAGFTDWRLPTKDELMMIYNNRHILGDFLFDGSANFYWSSTDCNYAHYAIAFTDGYIYCADYNNPYKVRAVRTITE